MGSKRTIKTKALLDKILSGDLSDTEKHDLRLYIESSYHDTELNELMAEHWDGLDKNEFKQEEPQLHLLKTRIWSMITDDQIPSQKSNKQLLLGWKSYLVRIAAVLLIPLLISSAYLFFHLYQQTHGFGKKLVMEQVVANPGSRVHFTLPDKTEVWLNSGSSLEYPNNLNIQKQRKVKLSGQGYFKVAHDKKHPFLVETEELTIKVLGTSFDVSSYSQDQLMTSTLEKGSIALLNSKGKEITRLEPGQMALLNRQTKELTIEKIDTQINTSWKEGKLIFKDTPLKNVANKLERWFNCTIEIDPELLNSDILYTATIQDETLGEVLEMIEISTSVETIIEQREVKIWNKN